MGKFFAILTTFREFLRKLMSCWRPYCAVGIPADASTVVGIPAIAGIRPADDVCDVPTVSAAVANVLIVSSCCCCWCPC
jgi:hypothetical protein